MMVVPLYHRHRILTQVAADNVNIVKLLPALICGQEEIDYFVAALDDVLKDAHEGPGLLFEFGRTMAKGALRKSGKLRPDAPYVSPSAHLIGGPHGDAGIGIHNGNGAVQDETNGTQSTRRPQSTATITATALPMTQPTKGQ
jgi:hypothetical protein